MRDSTKRWLDDVIKAMEELGGQAEFKDLYEKLNNMRQNLSETFEDTIRRTIYQNSSDSKAFNGQDVFYSVRGLRRGVWGLRLYNPIIQSTPKPVDFDSEPDQSLDIPQRVLKNVYRILRDTKIARWVKSLYDYKCQICSHTITLPNGDKYSEAHHIKPLGQKHSGPDHQSNILCLCPNHHAELDYGVFQIEMSKLTVHPRHMLNQEFIDYHNTSIYKG